MSVFSEKIGDWDVCYDEDEDLWKAGPGFDRNLTAKSLKALRVKLAKIEQAERRLDSVSVLLLEGWGRAGETLEAKAVLLADDRSVWVLTQEGRTEQRRKVDLTRVIPDRDEEREAIQKARRLYAEAEEIKTKADTILHNIRRHTAVTLKGIANPPAEAPE
jgi:hypothetical protein